MIESKAFLTIMNRNVAPTTPANMTLSHLVISFVPNLKDKASINKQSMAVTPVVQAPAPAPSLI